MPSITALLHTYNDALRLGRCLETLYPCDEILIVDRGSTDETITVAHDYGARVVISQSNQTPQWQSFVSSTRPTDLITNWILCLDPRESVSESLAASLYEWKSQPGGTSASVYVREETAAGWVSHPSAQTRLVPAGWKEWDATLPSPDTSAIALAGELLRFSLP
jgi:hypothetical protein